jgi:adenylate cyclase
MVQGRTKRSSSSIESVYAARELLLRCVSLDPDFALGWAELARAERQLHRHEGGTEYLEDGLRHAQRALELDPEEPAAHMALSDALNGRGDGEAAVAAARRATELAPSDASLRLDFGMVLSSQGHSEEAVRELRSLTRLDPALRPTHLFLLGIAYRQLGRTDEAIAKFQECAHATPDFYAAHMNLAAAYASLGDMNHAREWLTELMRVRPDFSVAKVPRIVRRELLIEDLRKAGLREE